MPPPPPMQREPVRRTVVAVRAIGPLALLRVLLRRLLLRLAAAAGDERRQPLDVFLVGRRHLLRPRLRVLRLGLRVVLLARIERLWLAWCERFAADGGLFVIVVVAVIGNIAARLARLLVVGLTLAKLLLRRRDQTEVMLRVLIVVFGGDRVSGTLRISGQLKVLFRNVGHSSPNFHVRSIGLYMRDIGFGDDHLCGCDPACACSDRFSWLLFANPLIYDGTDAAVSPAEYQSNQTH